MADDDHIARLRQGTAAWNAWRGENPSIRPELIRAYLPRANLIGADLIGASLCEANLNGASLSEANLSGANLHGADLSGANLGEAKLSGAYLHGANLSGAYLHGANLSGAKLSGTSLSGANLGGANLSGADIHGATLSRAYLYGANLSGANLYTTVLVDTDLTGADLTGCYIYGISACNLKLERAKQQNLVITPQDEPAITVDNVEVAQFIYLLLHNQKIRDVIDTIGRKGVLLLGRFTEGRLRSWNACARSSAALATCRWSSTSTSLRRRISPKPFACWPTCPTS